MKISNANPNAVSSTKIGGQSSLEQQKIENKRESNPGAISSSAQVEVSQDARQIQKAMELAKVGDDGVDTEKVARLQKLIDSGSYKVDAQAIADRLVDEHFKMPT